MKEKVSHEDLTIHEDYTIHTHIANFSDNFFCSEFNALSSDINHFLSHQFYSSLLNSSMNFSLVFLFFIFNFNFGNCGGNIYPHLAALVLLFQGHLQWNFNFFRKMTETGMSMIRIASSKNIFGGSRVKSNKNIDYLRNRSFFWILSQLLYNTKLN